MSNHQELIELYHSGNMSPEQLIDFENQLESNPELKAESDFQSDIINGLKEVRKAELKSRLNAIDVGPGWMEFAMQSTLIKSFGGVAVASLIGAGVYMLADKQETFDSSKTITEITDPQPQVPYSFDLPIPKSSLVKAQEEGVDLVAETLPEESAGSKVFLEEEEEEIKEDRKAVVPDFIAPNANLVEDENKFESSNLDKLPKVTSPKDGEIEVSMENTNSVDVRYKYYDGKLFLKGDFDRAPYEILEINSANGRRIFIQYLNKYYQVKTTDKLADLPEVTDQELIQELKMLKESK